MKTRFLSFLLLSISFFSFPSFSQTATDAPLLGLPGDDLDLYAVLDLFQKSKTIEDFEKSLNDEDMGVSNLDLNNDGNVDFVKVVTEKDGDDFLFILQDPISEKEIQDVAVISVSKDAADKVSLQIIGDEDLYGKDYVVEPATEISPGVTANPAYVGNDPVTVNVEATTEVIVVESTPVVQYVYSPAYVPYYPPYYYGYYPHYWRPIAVISIGIYRHNHWHHHHGGYHGGHGPVHIHNRNTYNNYNSNRRNTSNTVSNNISKGNFDTAGKGGSRTSNRASTSSQYGRTRSGASTSPSNRASNRPSTPSTSNTYYSSRSSRQPSSGRSFRGGGRRR